MTIPNKIALPKIDHSAHLLFAVVASVFGLLFVFSTPLLWGADETTHVGRVYELSRGQLKASLVHEGYSKYGYGGRVPQNLKELIDHVHVDINLDQNQRIPGVKKVDDPQAYKEFAKLPLSGKKVDFNFSNTAIYSPVSYAPSVLGFWIADLLGLRIGPTIYLARLFDLALYIGVLTFVIRSLRACRSKWIVFAVALIPAALFQSSIINADTVTNTLAFALVAMVLKALLSKRLSRPEIAVLMVATVLLPIAKPSYLFISLLVLLVPSQLIMAGHEKYRRFLLPTMLLVGFCLYALWQYETAYLTNASKWMIAGIAPWWQGIDSSAQLKYA